MERKVLYNRKEGQKKKRNKKQLHCVCVFNLETIYSGRVQNTLLLSLIMGILRMQNIPILHMNCTLQKYFLVCKSKHNIPNGK